MCHVFDFNAYKDVRCNYEKRKEIIRYDPLITSVKAVREGDPQNKISGHDPSVTLVREGDLQETFLLWRKGGPDLSKTRGNLVSLV